MSQDYNKTLKLPKTDFPMRGNLPNREPEMFNKFHESNIYKKMIDKNSHLPKYILHDGPPYANGDIHLGTALNKILKDIVIKYKNMSGYQAPYIPGWDTHGLPIELKAMKKLGIDKNNISPIEIREHSKMYALKYVEIQKEQFKRLGILGDFNNPYLTLSKEFESNQIKLFGEMAKSGYIYKGLKPVYWCNSCITALAEAEIEYSNDDCNSIYVKFYITEDNGFFNQLNIVKLKICFVIWTTTTWTIPGNIAIALGSQFSYSLVKVKDEYLIIAQDLVDEVMNISGIVDYEIINSFVGKDLEYIKVKHPFLDRESIVILGDHVTLESGTGCVHTAPGHGMDDFLLCKSYNLSNIVVVVDERGILNSCSGEFEGVHIKKATQPILDRLKSTNNLLSENKITHQYPHCWRCNNPVIFRATEQWFCSINRFKNQVIEEIDKINFIPNWGKDRMTSMINDRSDWCISRQRIWGVPIPIFYCKDCNSTIITDKIIQIVSDLFKVYGSNSWYEKTADEILNNEVVCECGCNNFEKESDIMDVWFDSGVTHLSVLESHIDLKFPADLYLEGNDQYRGWFQSSLLTSVAYRGKAPYKTVCTHGWVVDGNGRKMSKSLGNGISPEKIIKQYGADILRLWVAASDYHADIRISTEILSQLTEGYRKIRNTARFILSNLSDFDPNINLMSLDSIYKLDKYIINKLNFLITECRIAYEKFDFHIVYQKIKSFCVLELSNSYFDIIKDRLYCEYVDSEMRRSIQSTLFMILDTLTRLISPILPFTSQEIWENMNHLEKDNTESIYLNDLNNHYNINFDSTVARDLSKIYSIAKEVQKAMELKREKKLIGSSLECKVLIYCTDISDFEMLINWVDDLNYIFISSQVNISLSQDGEYKSNIKGISITIQKADGDKCERCWVYTDNIIKLENSSMLCSRCNNVLQKLQQNN